VKVFDKFIKKFCLVIALFSPHTWASGHLSRGTGKFSGFDWRVYRYWFLTYRSNVAE
jgi:hypothetical protein